METPENTPPLDRAEPPVRQSVMAPEPPTTIQEMTRPAATPPASLPPAGTGGTLAKLMARTTSDHAGRGGAIRRRRIKFTIDYRVCEPGTFDSDFELVLMAPSSADEIAALKRAENNAGAMMHELTKACLVSLDGTPLRDGDLTREAVWEALGIGGRMLVSDRFRELTDPSPEQLGKSRASTTLL